jgi:hypothetical protein
MGLGNWLKRQVGLGPPILSKVVYEADAIIPPPPGLAESNPGPCPSCGAVNWSRGRIRVIPSIGIRDAGFPIVGQASVATFTCDSCGSFSRYGRAHFKDTGWVMLDRWMGGW